MDGMLGREFGGAEVSGGQWQRIAIARGIYRNNSLLILDEPTAAIDALEEKYLYEEFGELSRNCTSVIVTHRLAWSSRTGRSCRTAATASCLRLRGNTGPCMSCRGSGIDRADPEGHAAHGVRGRNSRVLPVLP